MIQLKQVSKSFNAAIAVENISFSVEEGENFVLLGTSGCGKTTTLRMINRLTEPTGGEIWVNGVNILQQKPEELRKSIGYVLQHHGLFPHYTVAENIAIVPKLLKWDKQKIQSRTIELLEKLHLPPIEFINAYPANLSGGQQQRVGLARALAADPPILLMDEPFGALDPVTRNSIRKEFAELEEFKKKTIVLVTHDVQEAFALADKICLMDKGKIVQTGTTSELLFHPANEFVSSFLSEQRFSLELQSISLKELQPYLSIPQISSITNNMSIWDALQQLSTTNNSIIKSDIGDPDLSIEALITAYGKYKMSLL